MYYLTAVVAVLTAVATSSNHSSYVSGEANMVTVYSSMPTTSSGSSIVTDTGHTPKTILSNLSTNAAMEFSTVIVTRTIYLTRTVSTYITYYPQTSSLAVQNIFDTVAEATNIRVSATENAVLRTIGHLAAPASSFMDVCPLGVPCTAVTTPTCGNHPLGIPCPTALAGSQDILVPVEVSTISGTSCQSRRTGTISPESSIVCGLLSNSCLSTVSDLSSQSGSQVVGSSINNAISAVSQFVSAFETSTLGIGLSSNHPLSLSNNLIESTSSMVSVVIPASSSASESLSTSDGIDNAGTYAHGPSIPTGPTLSNGVNVVTRTIGCIFAVAAVAAFL